MESPCKTTYCWASSLDTRRAGPVPGVYSDDMTSGVLMRTVLQLPVLTHVRVGFVAVTRGAWHHSRAAARPQLRPPDPARKRLGTEAEQPSSSPAPSPKLSLPSRRQLRRQASPHSAWSSTSQRSPGIRSPTSTHSFRHSGSKLVPQPSWRNRGGISESGASDDTSGGRTVVASEDPWQSTDSLHSCRPSIR